MSALHLTNAIKWHVLCYLCLATAPGEGPAGEWGVPTLVLAAAGGWDGAGWRGEGGWVGRIGRLEA
jgi:hypothetical protein